MLGRVAREQVRSHRHLIINDMQASSRDKRRKDARVPQISADSGNCSEMQLRGSLGHSEAPANEIAVIHEIKMLDGDALRKSGRTGRVDHIHQILRSIVLPRIVCRFFLQQSTISIQTKRLPTELWQML